MNDDLTPKSVDKQVLSFNPDEPVPSPSEAENNKSSQGAGTSRSRETRSREARSRHRSARKKPSNRREKMPRRESAWTGAYASDETSVTPVELGQLPRLTLFKDSVELEALEKNLETYEVFEATELYFHSQKTLEKLGQEANLSLEDKLSTVELIHKLLEHADANQKAIHLRGVVEQTDKGFGFLVFAKKDYRVEQNSAFISKVFFKKYGLQRGMEIEVYVKPALEATSTPYVASIRMIQGIAQTEWKTRTPFKELIPYYPTERILLESDKISPEQNHSMRVIDLLAPVGFGQRGLIVAPPRTGKTVLLQGIAHSIRENYPEAMLIVLLIDERPEEVTDFRRSVEGAEIIASTFDQSASNHVHIAELVIERARCKVELGENVIILLDSITRLARAYNTLVPSGGKILSGGVEATALKEPKRFFGSARNIEGGGSLTILGTALVETGSRMDEVIFEEFKGTGNMELNLDRALSNKRIYPALNFDTSGTRKEELLYHADEMKKIHELRRAMKGIPSEEAMEMLNERIKRSRTNVEFLMGLN